ncbi:ATP-binding protein [Burkholderia dolosa]|uniref:AAA family ATPase n=1 Tax=Burkholderia dolosa TaxID=152500 RepID=UPI001B921DEE|nr:ATP-binding protein [Burkholderia dolosa]MBR8314679.1 ATP-binding protein [Burkholderia dolosa]
MQTNSSKSKSNCGFANTQNMTLAEVAIERALSRSANLPGLVCFYGPSGWGKSIATNTVAQNGRGYYVQARSVWTKKAMLMAILFEMGMRPAPTVSEMVDQVAQQLAASQRPLVIDEFDHVVERNNVELVRDIYESSRAPVLIVGEEGLPHKLKKWERFHGRVLSWVPAQPANLADAQQLKPLYAPRIELADDLLAHMVDIAHGSVRRICVNLERVQELALTNGVKRFDLDSWMAFTSHTSGTELYTGEAPRRRI